MLGKTSLHADSVGSRVEWGRGGGGSRASEAREVGALDRRTSGAVVKRGGTLGRAKRVERESDKEVSILLCSVYV